MGISNLSLDVQTSLRSVNTARPVLSVGRLLVISSLKVLSSKSFKTECFAAFSAYLVNIVNFRSSAEKNWFSPV